ncbi:hypothetical protein FRC04_011518 [Tulasnella sp. 424]|nr:hypothetical protein FRC04_011518 [Tulasnella sp. 424]KAG8971660.1 hypothetical protein FRC05_010916 [Tulasnella sp. 425]
MSGQTQIQSHPSEDEECAITSKPNWRCYLQDLPEELILFTLTFLDASTLSAFTQASRYFKAVATPILYRNIEVPSSTEGYLNGQNATARLIRTLVYQPSLARYIHSIDNLPITLHPGFVTILFAPAFSTSTSTGPRLQLNLLPPNVPEVVMKTCENLRHLSIDARLMWSTLPPGGGWLRFLLDPRIRLRSLIVKGRPPRQTGLAWDEFAPALLTAQSELEYLEHPGFDRPELIYNDGNEAKPDSDKSKAATFAWVPKLRVLKGTHLSIFKCLLFPHRPIEEIGFHGVSMTEISFRLVPFLRHVPTITSFSCNAQSGPRMDLKGILDALPSLRTLKLAILLSCSYEDFFCRDLPSALGSAAQLEHVDLRNTTSEIDGTDLVITKYTGPHPSTLRKQQSLLFEYGALACSLRSFVFPDERSWTRSSIDSGWEKKGEPGSPVASI